MGKDSKHKSNRKHHHRKDRKGKEERSKKEHFSRKEKDAAKQKLKEEEENRYTFDGLEHNKLVKILKQLIEYNKDVVEPISEVFDLLDSNNELDITDIEDGKIRESLEKIFLIFFKQIEKTEDHDGRFVYFKIGKKSLKEQILQYFKKAKSADNADHISDSLTNKLEQEFFIEKPKTKDKPLNLPNSLEIRKEIEAYNSETRPKSLMEMHLEKKNFSKNSAEKYIYGQKSLKKRFGEGKFIQ